MCSNRIAILITASREEFVEMLRTRRRMLSFSSGTDVCFNRLILYFLKVISWEWGGHVFEKYRHHRLSIKGCPSNWFTGWSMWGGALPCMKMISWRHQFYRSYDITKSLSISRYRCPVIKQDLIPFAVISSKNILSNGKSILKNSPNSQFSEYKDYFWIEWGF